MRISPPAQFQRGTRVPAGLSGAETNSCQAIWAFDQPLHFSELSLQPGYLRCCRAAAVISIFLDPDCTQAVDSSLCFCMAPDDQVGGGHDGHADGGWSVMTPTAALFADDPLALILLKVVVIFGFLLVMVLFMIWMESRVLAHMQHRPGLTGSGPFGLLQSLAEGPAPAGVQRGHSAVLVDRWVYVLAPVI